MLQEHVTPLLLAVVAVVHGASLLALVAVLLAPTSDVGGWRVVGPGGTHWFSFLGSWGFAALMTWVWLFVGSGRRDAAMQMNYALMLIVAFGVCSAFSGVYIARLRRMALRWRGTMIRWRKHGRDVVEDMADFREWRRTLSGSLHLLLRDGNVLRLDLHSRNAEDLAAEISETTGLDID